jgi:hypothetical protein
MILTFERSAGTVPDSSVRPLVNSTATSEFLTLNAGIILVAISDGLIKRIFTILLLIEMCG